MRMIPEGYEGLVTYIIMARISARARKLTPGTSLRPPLISDLAVIIFNDYDTKYIMRKYC